LITRISFDLNNQKDIKESIDYKRSFSKRIVQKMSY